MNRIREKFLNHELSVGTFTQLSSTVAVECLGRTGLDYVLIDTEHSAVGIEFLSSAITAADAAGIVPLVRINDITRSKVLQPLDYGAQGLIVPAVETVDQVRRLVEYAKFPPWATGASAPPGTAATATTRSPCRARRPISPTQPGNPADPPV